MTVIGDILVVQVMKQTGFTIGDYSKRHHGGLIWVKTENYAKSNWYRRNDS